MTRQDIIGIREEIYLRVLYWNAAKSEIVCEKHNREMFGGSLPKKNVSRGARCRYCIEEK